MRSATRQGRDQAVSLVLSKPAALLTKIEAETQEHVAEPLLAPFGKERATTVEIVGPTGKVKPL